MLTRLLLVASLLVTSSALAADPPFSNSDLSGGYAIRVADDSVDARHEHPLRMGGVVIHPGRYALLGALTFDGAGQVTGGTRTLWRVAEYHGTGSGPTDVLQQTATGTYAVDPNGIVSIQLTWQPAPTFVVGECATVRWNPNETWSAVVTQHGFDFVQRIDSEWDWTCPNPTTNAQPGVFASGTATRQRPVAPAATNNFAPIDRRVVR